LGLDCLILVLTVLFWSCSGLDCLILVTEWQVQNGTLLSEELEVPDDWFEEGEPNGTMSEDLCVNPHLLGCLMLALTVLFCLVLVLTVSFWP